MKSLNTIVLISFILLAQSCKPRIETYSSGILTTVTIGDFFNGIRAVSEEAASNNDGFLQYFHCKQKLMLDSANFLHGPWRISDSNGKIEACVSRGKIQHLLYRGPGTLSGLSCTNLYINSMRVLKPSWVSFSDNDSLFSGPVFGSDLSYRCFIVPFPSDSMHLLIRTNLRPEHEEIRQVTAENVTSIHLIGDDLESRIQMRFERGREYYVTLFIPNGDLSTPFVFQRSNSVSHLEKMTLEGVKAILSELLKQHPDPPEESLRMKSISRRRFAWEQSYVDSRSDSEWFDLRIFDNQKPFPIFDK